MSVDDEARLHPWLERILRARIGHAPRPWPQALRRTLERLARERGETPEELLRGLLGSRDGPLIDALVASATVPHTSFLRHPVQFERFRVALAALGRPARIWSAGCASGEEAYSIALVARELGVEVELLATDVNDEALAVARRGTYPAAALRRAGLDAPGELWVAPEELRACLRFERASLTGPSPALDRGRFDFVFCRNVLIYFDADASMDVLETLADHLAPRGALVIAPVDALRRLPPSLQRAEPLGWLERAPDEALVSAPIETPAPRRRSTRPPPSALDPTEELLTRAARALGLGAFDDAERALHEVLAVAPSRADAWFLLGELLVQRGEPTQARTAFERAAQHAPPDAEGQTLAAAARRRAWSS